MTLAAAGHPPKPQPACEARAVPYAVVHTEGEQTSAGAATTNERQQSDGGWRPRRWSARLSLDDGIRHGEHRNHPPRKANKPGTARPEPEAPPEAPN